MRNSTNALAGSGLGLLGTPDTVGVGVSDVDMLDELRDSDERREPVSPVSGVERLIEGTVGNDRLDMLTVGVTAVTRELSVAETLGMLIEGTDTEIICWVEKL